MSAQIYRYRLPLTKPLQIGSVSLTERTGLILVLNGACSEIAPLPGLHQETLDEAFTELRDMFAGNRTLEDLSPSVRFGLETARLKLENTLTLKHPIISSNALVTPSSILDGIRQASHYVTRGFSTLKIKVGRLELADEIHMVTAIRAAVGRRAHIRLDANRAFTLQQAIELAYGLKRQAIAYIEEPLKNPNELAEFSKHADIPVALDESLLENISLEGIRIGAFVIKPSIIGSYERIGDLIRIAKERSFDVVFSSTFESGLGLDILTCLASSLGPTNVASGISTSDWLGQDIVTPPFRLARDQAQARHSYDRWSAFAPQDSKVCELIEVFD